jgi:hypothetical protein
MGSDLRAEGDVEKEQREDRRSDQQRDDVGHTSLQGCKRERRAAAWVTRRRRAAPEPGTSTVGRKTEMAIFGVGVKNALNFWVRARTGGNPIDAHDTLPLKKRNQIKN